MWQNATSISELSEQFPAVRWQQGCLYLRAAGCITLILPRVTA